MSLILYYLFLRKLYFLFFFLGINCYYDNLEMMFGFCIVLVMKICWMFVMFLFLFVSYKINNVCCNWFKYVIIL